MLKLKVRKFGNSLGFVLPKEVINRLRAKSGGTIFLIEAPDGGYRLMPYTPSSQERMAKAGDIIGRFRGTLQVLTK